ncbi:MAG: SPOR domain-containing protein [Sellimonas intestinalis]
MQNPVVDMDSVPDVMPELTPEVEPEEEEAPPRYHIQVGAFRNMENAERLKEELLADEFPAFVNRIGPYFIQGSEWGSLHLTQQCCKHRTERFAKELGAHERWSFRETAIPQEP